MLLSLPVSVSRWTRPAADFTSVLPTSPVPVSSNKHEEVVLAEEEQDL
jgi:hypothetical protein